MMLRTRKTRKAKPARRVSLDERKAASTAVSDLKNSAAWIWDNIRTVGITDAELNASHAREIAAQALVVAVTDDRIVDTIEDEKPASWFGTLAPYVKIVLNKSREAALWVGRKLVSLVTWLGSNSQVVLQIFTVLTFIKRTVCLFGAYWPAVMEGSPAGWLSDNLLTSGVTTWFVNHMFRSIRENADPHFSASFARMISTAILLFGQRFGMLAYMADLLSDCGPSTVRATATVAPNTPVNELLNRAAREAQASILPQFAAVSQLPNVQLPTQ